MGMYVSVNAEVYSKNNDKETKTKALDNLLERLEALGYCVSEFDICSLWYDNTSLSTDEDFQNAALEVVKAFPDIEIEATFDYDADDCDYMLIVNSDGVFIRDKIASYGDPYPIKAE